MSHTTERPYEAPAQRAMGVLARFYEVERFLGFMEGFAMIADDTRTDHPMNSRGMDFVAHAAGDALVTLRTLRREFEAQPAAG